MTSNENRELVARHRAGAGLRDRWADASRQAVAADTGPRLDPVQAAAGRAQQLAAERERQRQVRAEQHQREQQADEI